MIFKKILQQVRSGADNLKPIDLSMPLLKVLGTKWITKMVGYLDNLQFITNGFWTAEIPQAIDDDFSTSNEDEHTDTSSNNTEDKDTWSDNTENMDSSSDNIQDNTEIEGEPIIISSD